MIFNILDNTTELWMTKYIIGEFFSSGGATLYKNPSDQTVRNIQYTNTSYHGNIRDHTIITVCSYAD